MHVQFFIHILQMHPDRVQADVQLVGNLRSDARLLSAAAWLERRAAGTY